MARKEPSTKDKSETGKLSQDLNDFLTELRHKVKKDDTNRGNWKQKMIVAGNQRLGVKRYTNYPYPGAPDIPLPETDKLIKKSVPNLVLSAWAPKKMCLVRVKQGVKPNSQMIEKAKRCELALNMVLRSPETGTFNKLHLAADFTKQYGHCLFRITEDFNSRMVHKVIDLNDFTDEQRASLKAMGKEEKIRFLEDRYDLERDDKGDKKTIDSIIKQFGSGKDVIEFDVEEISSLPNFDVPLPTKVIVPSYVTDINKSPRITLEYFLTREQLEAKMDSEIFRDKDIDDLDLSGVSKVDDDMVEQSKARNEGTEGEMASKDIFRIHETLCYYKPKKSEPSQRWAFTFLADTMDAEESLLQDIEFPFEFDGWNYEKHDNEVKDPRYYASRGVPEQIRALQEILERSINNMIIRDEMNNTPMYEVLDTSDIMDAHIRFVPGQKLPVKAVGQEIKQVNEASKVDISSDRIMQIIKAYAEEYAGSSDQLFRNATNVGGGKTLGEIKEGVKQQSGQLNLDVISWNDTLSRVYKKMFDIMAERLGSSIFINDIEITREDFNFPAEVKSNGTLEVSDQQIATQKAIMRIGVISDPKFADCVNSEDKYNALKDWLEKDGVKDPDLFSTDPKIIAQQQIAQLQQGIQQLSMQYQQLQEQLQSTQKQTAKEGEKFKKQQVQQQGKKEA